MLQRLCSKIGKSTICQMENSLKTTDFFAGKRTNKQGFALKKKLTIFTFTGDLHDQRADGQPGRDFERRPPGRPRLVLPALSQSRRIRIHP